MGKFILNRFLIMVAMLAALSFIVFLIIELPPGDYADRAVYRLKASGVTITEQEIIGIRHQLGLDRPFLQRYFIWVSNIVLHGNWGISMLRRLPVTAVIGERLGFTAALAIVTLFFTYGLAIPIGILSAIRQYSLTDYAFTFVGYVGMATPNFLLALVLVYISVMVFGTSVGGLFSPQFVEAPWSFARVMDLFSHLWVAALVLAIAGTAFQIRTMRATLLDEKNKLYVTAARARGMSEGKLLLKYPVRVALNPIVSTIGWELAGIISGAPIVAFVLALPDTGPLFLTALLDQDSYLSGAMLLMYAGLTILGTFLSDIMLAYLDPRIRYGGA
ncbi:MAG TPA: ABC transporter permease [Chloroflexia bacterium]|nr:ABC transporter permease [Chloroflexia bacterium]